MFSELKHIPRITFPRTISGLSRRLSAIILLCLSIDAAAQNDSLVFSLEESSVSSYKNLSPISGDIGHGVSFTTSSVKSFPKLLGGDLDPIMVMQFLPGVQTNSGYSTGLNIQGFEDSQNIYTLAGAPTYLSPRLLGLFPTINQTHFSRFRMKTSTDDCFLGGALENEISDTLFSTTSGDASIGMLSARATISVPLSNKASMTASLRKSFINQIYKGALKVDNSTLGYDFTDVNLSLLWKPDSRNKIDANIYWAGDIAEVNDDRFNISVDGKWQQGVASLRWRHSGETQANAILYASGNFKDMLMSLDRTDAGFVSDIAEIGLKGGLNLPFNVSGDINIVFRGMKPLSASINETAGEYNLDQKTLQADIGLKTTLSCGLFSLTPGIRFSEYGELPLEKTWFNADPWVSAEVNLLSAGRLKLAYDRKHQYFSQVELSAVGLPFQFRFGSGEICAPQESHKISVSHSVDIKNGKWSISSQLYWARMLNQLEFRGFLIDFLSPGYSLAESLLKTEGFNYGAGIMLSKNTGALTGWLSYSYSRALRRCREEGFPDLFPASYDRPHELKAVLSWDLGRFNLGADMVLASGNPYTGVVSYYYIGESVMAEYEDFNSSRLKAMFRLDLSASYNFKSHGRFSHGVNLSVINATGRKNEYVNYLDLRGQYYNYRAGSFIIPILPSFSYFCKF